MIKKLIVVLVIILLHSSSIYADEFKKIEIFDSSKNEVIRQVKLSGKIQELIVTYLNELDGVYAKNNPIPDDCIAIKIPLDPTVKIQNKWLNASVDEVIIIVPKNEQSFLIAFDDKDNVICFPFKENIDVLLKNLNIKQ